MREWQELLKETSELLETPHLVWSQDFEVIRGHLWALIRAEMKSLAPHQATLDLCKDLIDEVGKNNG